MAHPYDVGTKAWQPDPTEGWVASEVISKTADGDKIKLVFELANGEVCLQQLPKLQIASNARSIKADFISRDRPKR
jgi:myosin-5